MSRGLGRWQRTLIVALEEHPELILTDLLPPGYSRSQYVALHRAAESLHHKKLEILHSYTRRIWVARLEYVSLSRPESRRVKY